MSRRVAALAVAAPIAAGTLAAHQGAYALAGVAPGTAHGYLAYAPLALVVLTLAAFGALLADTRPAALARPWLFVAVGLGAFAGQEHVERLLHDGQAPWLLTSPVFLLGLALQLPFALLAWLAARSLATVVEALLTVPHRPRGAVLRQLVTLAWFPPCRSALVLPAAARGPPQRS